MSEIAPSEKIQDLDRRQTQLLEEIDALNFRLEETLNRLLPSAPDAELA